MLPDIGFAIDPDVTLFKMPAARADEEHGRVFVERVVPSASLDR